jgi:hypothetical protein
MTKNSKDTRDVFIVGAARTPIGGFLGTLSSFPSVSLGKIVIEEALKRAKIPKTEVDSVIMGNVLTSGVGQAPARQACLGAGLPETVGCLTINKVCGSGLKAVMIGTQAIKAGDAVLEATDDGTYVTITSRATSAKWVSVFYTVEDAQKTLNQFYGVGYERAFVVTEGVVCSFYDAGHILGSALVHLIIYEKEKDLVKRFIDLNEELCFKTNMALIDAGVPVIIQTDDFAFKSGPLMNPKLIDEIFGPSYKRIIKAVHDRGAKYVLHSCGDNTLLIGTFISWGVDGLHAYEMASNVDIYKEKKMMCLTCHPWLREDPRASQLWRNSSTTRRPMMSNF